MDETGIKQAFFKTTDILSGAAKTIGEITSNVETINSEAELLGSVDLSEDIAGAADKFIAALDEIDEAIFNTEENLNGICDFVNNMEDMDDNLKELSDIKETGEKLEGVVSSLVAETTKWKNKGAKMKGYEERKRKIKGKMKFDFDDNVMVLINQKLDKSIACFEEKIKDNERILSALNGG